MKVAEMVIVLREVDRESDGSPFLFWVNEDTDYEWIVCHEVGKRLRLPKRCLVRARTQPVSAVASSSQRRAPSSQEVVIHGYFLGSGSDSTHAGASIRRAGRSRYSAVLRAGPDGPEEAEGVSRGRVR